MPASLSFFRAWLKAPLRVAAIAPSSSGLADLITSEIGRDTGPVIELGPGTGVFTQAIIARGVSENELALVELGSEFSAALRQRFPRVQLLNMDAAHLHRVDLFSGWPAGAVVSGLPLLSMPDAKVFAILRAAFAAMAPDGSFYQFTYGLRCPVERRVLDRLGLEAERIGGTFANLPPAAVYRLRRREAFRHSPGSFAHDHLNNTNALIEERLVVRTLPRDHLATGWVKQKERP
jgi:phosphatidylethanolamine/phosphatidyl-N-methylethanolamine N-methyltransferase